MDIHDCILQFQTFRASFFMRQASSYNPRNDHDFQRSSHKGNGRSRPANEVHLNTATFWKMPLFLRVYRDSSMRPMKPPNFEKSMAIRPAFEPIPKPSYATAIIMEGYNIVLLTTFDFPIFKRRYGSSKRFQAVHIRFLQRGR
jgi:hypothetical protein